MLSVKSSGAYLVFLFLTERGFGPFTIFFFMYFNSTPRIEANLCSYLFLLIFSIIFFCSLSWFISNFSYYLGLNFYRSNSLIFANWCLSISSIVILWSGPKYMIPTPLFLSFLLRILSCEHTIKLCSFGKWSSMQWSTSWKEWVHLSWKNYLAFCKITEKSWPKIYNYYTVHLVTFNLILPGINGLSLYYKLKSFYTSIFKKLPSIIKL